MDEKYLVMIDISKKQEYIYSSNNLKDIIGASYIIKYVSEFLGLDILISEFNSNKNDYYNSDNKSGKIVYDKGGNSIFIFSEDEKNRFIDYFSKVAYILFPGLNFNIVETKFNPKKDSVVKALHNLEHKLIVKKNTAQPKGSIFSGSQSFGYTHRCKHSGMPSGYEYKQLLIAVFGKEDRINYEEASLSETTIVKRAMFYMLDPYSKTNWENNMEISSKERKDNISRILRDAPYYKENNILNMKIGENLSILDCIHEFNIKIKESKGFENSRNKDGKDITVTNDIDEYMKQENTRIHGVVTADGNGMGKLFKDLDKAFNNKYKNIFASSSPKNIEETVLNENLKYIALKLEISGGVEKLYEKALNGASGKLIEYLSKDYNDKKALTVPLRILVSAGDDLTFIIGGKYMLDFINRYLKLVNPKSLDPDLKVEYSKYINCEEPIDMTFGIGSVLIDSKYPLYRAIEKASKLESKSKGLFFLIDDKNKELKKKNEENGNIKINNNKYKNASIISYNLFRGDIDDRGSDNLYINESEDWIQEKLDLINRDGEVCRKTNTFSYATLIESIKTFNEKNKSERNSLTTELVGLYKNDPFYIKEFMFTHNLNEKSLIDTIPFFNTRDNSDCMELFKDVFELSNYYEEFAEGR